MIATAGPPGPIEWLIIGAIALLLFGRRLPAMMRSLGRAIGAFGGGQTGSAAEQAADSLLRRLFDRLLRRSLQG